MNPVYWLFARVLRYIHTLKPEAIESQLPVATVFVLKVLLLTPLIQAMMLVELGFSLDIGALGIVAVWLLLARVTWWWFDEERVARILRDYPVNPTSKGRAVAFFSALVLLTLLLQLFPLARLLQDPVT
jgi:membrane protease YdiL (CAAX protease family)